VPQPRNHRRLHRPAPENAGKEFENHLVRGLTTENTEKGESGLTTESTEKPKEKVFDFLCVSVSLWLKVFSRFFSVLSVFSVVKSSSRFLHS
jgi:hypothetical protein